MSKPKEILTKQLKTSKLIKRPGFFIILALILFAVIVAVVIQNLSFLVKELDTTFDGIQIPEAPQKFDIEGFESLNLIKQDDSE